MDLKYDNWIKKVDGLLVDTFGLGVEDLEDYIWMDLYEDDNSPQEAFEDFIESDYSPIASYRSNFELICQDCETADETVIITNCPYQQDVNNKEVEVILCGNCYRERCYVI